jgi:Prealbumin-like fold domain
MTERVLGPTGSPRRRKRLLGLTALIAAAFAAFFVVGAAADQAGGCDFSPANNGTAGCLGALVGSTFAGGDGNLLTTPTNFGTTDWQGVSGRNGGVDLPSGTGDNSFGQGSKTDDPNITVVTGSIPPNKSDLVRFYEASEVGSNSHNFLYLAWERTNVLGSANFNFEINKLTQPNLTTAGAKTLARSAGDLLVTYDFDNGGGRPTIGLLRWLTSASVPVVPNFAANTCFSANGFPCWGDKVTLDGTEAISAVNNLGSVTDPIAPNAPRSLPALTFGETAIDLTNSGVFPAGTCKAFGSTMVTGRSSSSFTSEIKDFIAPIPVNISNCGTVNIIKHTNPRGVNAGFGYTSTIPSTSECTNDTTPAGFTLNDDAGVDPTAPITQGTANTEHCANVPAGSYTVTENTPLPASFVLESLTCSVSGSGGSTGAQDATNLRQANISLQPGDTVTCTYTNKQQLGAIKVSKDSIKTGTQNLSGAEFSVTGPNNFSQTLTTDSTGTACVDHLAFGSYSVTETKAPAGYTIDDTSAHPVTVNVNEACDVAAVDFPATDTPLTDITVEAKTQATGGTASSINCIVQGSNPAVHIGNSPQPASGFTANPKVTATGTSGVVPGTYVCTIVVDP